MRIVLALAMACLLVRCGYQDQALAPNLSKDMTPKIQNPDDVEKLDPKDLENLDKTVTLEDFEKSWQYLLDHFVQVIDQTTGDTRIDYQAIADLKNDLQSSTPSNQALEFSENKKVIESFLSLVDFDHTLSHSQRIALLINAYNYFVIDIISDYLPIKSINDIPAVFDRAYFNFNSQKISLNYLEQYLLYSEVTLKASSRKQAEFFNRYQASEIDARYHFAVICGAKGCPILSPEAYKADTLHEQLNAITEKAFSLKRIFENTNKAWTLIELFDWYAEDFKAHVPLETNTKSESIVNFIEQYSNRTYKRQKIEIPKDYDWSLNSVE
ncbi:MAG: DUF547 domain-containing protein [Halobacteriovoraceae bacterium]|nr:DUF547 domain-containing protein [Halobacteriovoraceae bacterium]